MDDVVNKPKHYQHSVEPIDAIESWGLGYHLGSACKYISRAGKKEGNPTEQDIKKAIWYLERYLTTLKGK